MSPAPRSIAVEPGSESASRDSPRRVERSSVKASASTNATPWKRHPTADVNIGESGTSTTYISSLARYNTVTNKVKVMDSQGTWLGTNTTLTPSCFSCHKAHGNKNPFGLIFMNGTGTRTEEGDGGAYKDLCRQCHSEGA